MGKQCQMNIDTVNKRILAQTVEATPIECLLSTRELNDNLDLATNDADIIFGSKGNPNNDIGSIYVVYMVNGTPEQRCFVVSPGLGIMRTGEYDGDPAILDANNCVALP